MEKSFWLNCKVSTNTSPLGRVFFLIIVTSVYFFSWWFLPFDTAELHGVVNKCAAPANELVDPVGWRDTGLSKHQEADWTPDHLILSMRAHASCWTPFGKSTSLDVVSSLQLAITRIPRRHIFHCNFLLTSLQWFHFPFFISTVWDLL